MNEFKHIQPIVVEITLYRNNWKDSRLIAGIKNQLNYLPVKNDENAMIVSRSNMRALLELSYSKEILEFNSIPQDQIYNDVNSIYFINRILYFFDSLQYFRIKISDKRNYTRISESEGIKLIDFNYKILYAKLDLTMVLNTKSLFQVK